jgi:aspartate kinase
VQDASAMKRVIEIVRSRGIDRRTRSLVVLSACAGVTNALIRVGELALRPDTSEALREIQVLEERHERIVKELLQDDSSKRRVVEQLGAIWDELRKLVRGVHLLRELTAKSKDQFQSVGERCSTLIFHAALSDTLRGSDTPALYYDAREFFVTSSEFTAARPFVPEITKRMQKIRRELAEGAVGVTQGFIGTTTDDQVTTIGRGGSDFSAAIQGVAIGAKEIQIWTDVAGILTCDPRVVSTARTVPFVSFSDASQLAFFGAKVLHPETIWPAVEEGIPVLVLSSREPENPGTTIVAETDVGTAVTGIAIKRDVMLVRVGSRAALPDPAVQEAVWAALREKGIVPLATSLSIDSALYAFDTVEALAAVRQSVEGIADVDAQSGRAMISLVGEGLRNSTGVGARAFQSLGKINCEMISYGGSDTTVSFVVDGAKVNTVVRRLHDRFFR